MCKNLPMLVYTYVCLCLYPHPMVCVCTDYFCEIQVFIYRNLRRMQVPIVKSPLYRGHSTPIGA